MGLSIWQILIVVLLLVLLFGRGKISELMGDMAKGIKSFKKGMAEDEEQDSSQERPQVTEGRDDDSPIDVTPKDEAGRKKDSA
jgi:sec-independent protein translocase protein TatA